MVVAIWASLAIIFPATSAYLGNRNYMEEAKVEVEVSSTPEEVVQDFYAWYLGYIGDRAGDEIHNPMVDGVYRDCGFLSTGFVQELDILVADGLAFDPILMAQDIPHDFSVAPGTEEGTAIVHLQFGSETVHHLKVSTIEEMGAWKIDKVEQVK